jgi:hypothetical protein
MKSLIQFVLILTFLLTSVDIYPQLSTGRAPFNKARSHVNYGTFPLATIAYANDNSTSSNISMPIPDGDPFTVIGNFTAPNFAASMVKGWLENYYLLDIAPALYLFDPVDGTCTLLGNITGMGGDQPNGISYNPVDQKYYMVSGSALYTLDINTLQATLIGSFSPSISGQMIDLCFDENGTCYSYEINVTPGAANGYIIDVSNAHLTTLGSLGYTPNYGQGMSYDFENQIIYLSAFNYDTFSGQLRTMDKTTGMTTLLYDWGDQIAPFAVNSYWLCCCPIPPPSNPNPPNNATDIPINGTTLTWYNGEGTTAVAVWFGPTGNVVQVYDGPLINSWETGALQYLTYYHWYIRDKTDTCSMQGPTWGFMTEQNPNLLIMDFYPQSAQYWTGNTEGATKTDGEINTVYPNNGWAVFDISSIPPGSTIQDVTFNGYVNANDWPYWSATPMGSVNPVTDDAATINGQILAGYDQGVAYIYKNESGTITNDWHTYAMGNNAISDLQAAVNSGQGWFAVGFVDRDFSATYYINFDGWSQPNPPYIEITYIPIPVELTSFRADVNDGKVVLSWSTATETNNRGFEVERSDVRDQPDEVEISPKGGKSNGWESVGFVEGNGTTTLTHSYSYTDKNVTEGKYNYRLRQIDFDGSIKYLSVVEVTVTQPAKYSLEQNYPNPFNPSTVIEYQIPAESRVSLKVFDVLGREVKTIVDKNQSAGKYKINFNAGRLSNGIYYYRLTSGNFVKTKKMIVLK